MIKKKAVKIAKCTSRFITAILLAVALVLYCPSFSIISGAASDTAVWHVDSVANKSLYYYDYGTNRSTASLNLDIEKQISTYDISDLVDVGGQLTVSYEPFTYSLDLGVRHSGATVDTSRGSSLLRNVQPYIVDNFDNKYPLDSLNGGSFTIEDTSNITSLSLYFSGTVSGTITNNGTVFRYINIKANISAFDISFSLTGKPHTITDSEGTVWTVPEGVENPVVINVSDSMQVLFDASDLKYAEKGNGKLLASENIVTVEFYNPDGSLFTTMALSSLVQDYTIPFYTTSLLFQDFLYGSLPELTLEERPLPTPDPGDKLEELVAVKTEFKSDSNPYNDVVRYSTEDSEPKSNWFTTWDEESRDFDVWSSKRTMEAVDGKDDLYHTHFDEYVSYPLTFYTSSRAPYDGYAVVSFPKGFWFKEPENGTNVVTGAEYLSSWHIQVEIKPYILVQGVRYEISEFACSFSFPVYEEEPFSFTIGYEAHIRSDVTGTVPATVQWRCPFETSAHSVSVWFYADDDELSQILDVLEKYPGADKMEEDADNLKDAIKDYDEVSDSIFESAGEGIDNFDIASGFDFNSGILSSIGFIGTIISSIIVAMGDFSFLYTIGVCLVIVSVIIGLFKYFGGGDND